MIVQNQATIKVKNKSRMFSSRVDEFKSDIMERQSLAMSRDSASYKVVESHRMYVGSVLE